MTADVFVSYSRKDQQTAELLVERLLAAGIRVWIDRRSIDGASRWGEEIVEAIEGCKVLILLVSPASVTSAPVLREVALASEGEKPILPLHLEPVTIPRALRFHLVGIHHIELFEQQEEEWFPAVLRALAHSGVHAQHSAKAASAARPTPAPDRRRSLDQQTDEPHPTEPRQPPSSRSRPSDGAPVAVEHSVSPSAAPATETTAATARVAVLYKRHAQPDEQLMQFLESQLRAHGHEVFTDRHLVIGAEWVREIEQKLLSSDYVIPLLSGASAQSEMLEYEIQIAHDAAQRQQGKPQLLPVRVNYTGPLPDPLANILHRLEYALWEGPQDNERLLSTLLTALAIPPAPRPTALPRNPEPAGGAVPLDSEFYVVRDTDERLRAAIARQDSIVLLKGARQMGKTSLLARGLQQAREAGARVIRTDFQMLDLADLESVDQFFRKLAEWIADQLDLDVLPDEVWKPQLGTSVNFTRYLRREVLSKTETPIVWGLDEVDRLFPPGCGFGSQVFGLFRAWHNDRVLDPTGPWSRLTLAIAYATEAHLFITDTNQSPFNVGTRLPLEDFTFEQVADLNRRYGSPLRDGAEVARYYRLVSGQPYLVRRGLEEMTRHSAGMAAFEAQADRDEGIYGDHLRRILVSLLKDPALCDIVRGALRGEPCPNPESFYRLRTAGVLTGQSARDARPRCQLYTSYLERHLL